MNENELRQALAGHAAAVTPAIDTDRLAAGMVRVDRIRSIKMTGLACVATAIVTFGAVSMTQGEDAGPVDVVDQPDPTLPTDPEVALPIVDDADSEAIVTAPTSVPATATGTPDHLADAEETITTTVAVVTTTAAPTTTRPPTTTTTATPPASLDFTAIARYESYSEDPSYDEYSGTAAAGATITVTSPHNPPATVVVPPDGHWFLRVEFPTAPLDAAFTVTVSDGSSSADFGMIHTS